MWEWVEDVSVRGPLGDGMPVEDGICHRWRALVQFAAEPPLPPVMGRCGLYTMPVARYRWLPLDDEWLWGRTRDFFWAKEIDL